jgi:hypothetical protein
MRDQLRGQDITEFRHDTVIAMGRRALLGQPLNTRLITQSCLYYLGIETCRVAMHGTVRRKWLAHAQILRPQQGDPAGSDLPVLSTGASDAETGFSFLF